MASSRGQTWAPENILAPTRIWSDSAVQSQLDGASRTDDIWGDVAERLRAAGFDRKLKQFKDKTKDLKQYYKDLKDGHNRSGHDRSNWPYYDLMDDVLGDRPSTGPRNVIDTTHFTPPSMPSPAPGSPSQDDSVTGEHASPDLFESTLSQPTTPQSLDTGINVRTDTPDVKEEMPVVDQREEATATLSGQTRPATPQSLDTGINVRTDTPDVKEEMPVVDQREEATATLSGQTRPATSQPASRSKRPHLNALEKALSGVTERFLEHHD